MITPCTVTAGTETLVRAEVERPLVNPKALWESICAFSERYCPFHEDRTTAARWTESVLLKFAREHMKAVEAKRKASKAGNHTPPGGPIRIAHIPQQRHALAKACYGTNEDEKRGTIPAPAARELPDPTQM